jgi:hypothetical protein
VFQFLQHVHGLALRGWIGAGCGRGPVGLQSREYLLKAGERLGESAIPYPDLVEIGLGELQLLSGGKYLRASASRPRNRAVASADTGRTPSFAMLLSQWSRSAVVGSRVPASCA